MSFCPISMRFSAVSGDGWGVFWLSEKVLVFFFISFAFACCIREGLSQLRIVLLGHIWKLSGTFQRLPGTFWVIILYLLSDFIFCWRGEGGGAWRLFFLEIILLALSLFFTLCQTWSLHQDLCRLVPPRVNQYTWLLYVFCGTFTFHLGTI